MTLFFFPGGSLTYFIFPKARGVNYHRKRSCVLMLTKRGIGSVGEGESGKQVKTTLQNCGVCKPPRHTHTILTHGNIYVTGTHQYLSLENTNICIYTVLFVDLQYLIPCKDYVRHSWGRKLGIIFFLL